MSTLCKFIHPRHMRIIISMRATHAQRSPDDSLHHWSRLTNSSCQRHHRREREWIKEVIIRDVTRLVSTPDPSATSRSEFDSQQVGQRGPLCRPLRRNYGLLACGRCAWMEEMQFPYHPCRVGGDENSTSQILWPVNHRSVSADMVCGPLKAG